VAADEVTPPNRKIAPPARPGTDAERIRSPDGTDAVHRYTRAQPMRLRLVCMVVM